MMGGRGVVCLAYYWIYVRALRKISRKIRKSAFNGISKESENCAKHKEQLTINI